MFNILVTLSFNFPLDASILSTSILWHSPECVNTNICLLLLIAQRLTTSSSSGTSNFWMSLTSVNLFKYPFLVNTTWTKLSSISTFVFVFSSMIGPSWVVFFSFPYLSIILC